MTEVRILARERRRSGARAGDAFAKSRRRVLAVLFGLAAFNMLDQQLMSILLEPIRREFKLGDVQLGLLSGLAFAALYTALSVPAGMWAVRGSRRNLIALAAGVWGAATIASGFARSFGALLFARLGVGVGEAGGVTPSQAWLSDLFPPGERATALATLTAGGNFGVFLAFLFGGWIGHVWGWRAAFAAAGAPPLALALLLRFATTDPPPEAGVAARGSPALVAKTLRQMFGDPILRQVLAAAVLAMTVGYGALAWIPSFLVRSHGLNIAQAGAYLAVVIGLGGALGTWAGGRFSDVLRARDERWSLWLTALAFVVARPFAMAFYVVGDTRLALLLFVVPAASGTLHIGPCVAVLHERVDAELRPLASALFLTIVTLVGLGLGPLAVGAMSQLMFASRGENALGWALLVWQFIGFWAAIHFYFAGRRLGSAERAV